MSNPLADAINQAESPTNKVIVQAIEQAETDPGAPFEKNVIEALSAVKQSNMAQYLRYRAKLKKANPDVMIGELDKCVNSQSGDTDDGSGSIADILVSLTINKATLFTDTNKQGFVSFEQESHTETWVLNSTGFKEWLSYLFYREYGKAPREAAIKDALSTLAGIATHEGKECEVYLRCAPHPNSDGYLIDLCDSQWRVIEVTQTGWELLEQSPVRFKRTGQMNSLPIPVTGGKLSDLWQIVNIAEESRGLTIAWMLEAFRPETPFPVLEIGGEQGSAKSSTQSKLRDLIDPSCINLRAAPKTDEDVFVSAARNWLASYNNLSRLSASRQDALCTLATGGGYGGRKLYTNDEESVWESKRPVVINGISTLVTAPDLLDRTIRTESPKISTYISESELQAWFNEKRAGIFGGLLDLFVKALSILPDVQIDKPPRMTDFAFFGEAIYRANGKSPGVFLADYQKNREAAILQSIESSPVASAVFEMSQHKDFNGTVGELLDNLDRYRPKGDTGWPKSAKGLSDLLKRFAPPLRLMSVTVEFSEKRINRGRIVTIRSCHGSVEHTDLNVTNVTKTAKSDVSDGCDGEFQQFYTHPKGIYPDDVEVDLKSSDKDFLL